MKTELSSSLSAAEPVSCQDCAILQLRLEEAIRMREQLIHSEEFAWKKVEELQAQLSRLKSFLDD